MSLDQFDDVETIHNPYLRYHLPPPTTYTNADCTHMHTHPLLDSYSMMCHGAEVTKIESAWLKEEMDKNMSPWDRS